MLTLASDSSSGKLYEAFCDRRGVGRIAVRAGLGHHQLPIARQEGDGWGLDAALLLLKDLGYRQVTIPLAEQLLVEVLDRLPEAGWTLTEDTLRTWLAKHEASAA